MAEQRQPFWFRLPLLAPQRSTVKPPRPRASTSENPQAPSQPTSVPIQRSAFKPGGKAPAQSSPQQSQPPPKAESTSPSTTAKPPPPQSSTKTTPQSPPSSINSQSTSSQSANAKPQSSSRVAAESPKSSATAKPPSPSVTTTTALPKPATPSTSVANEAPKLDSQSTPSPKSPSHTTTAESPKSASPTIPKPPAQSFISIGSPKANPRSSSPKSVATNKTPSPSRSVNESLKTTPRTQPSPEATRESRIGTPQPGSPSQGKPRSTVLSDESSPSKGSSESKTSQLPAAASSRATSQAEQESVKVSGPQSPTLSAPQKESKASRKELKTIVENVSQSISSPAKPQDRGSSESPTSTDPQPSVAQEGTKKTEPQAPLQESEPKVEITSGNGTDKSASQDDAATGERIEGSRLAEGPISKEITALPQKPMEGESKGMVNKATTGFGNNGVESQSIERQQKHEISETKETSSTTSYIGKQVKTVGPSQPIEGNVSMSFQKPNEEGASRHREIKEDISKLVRRLITGPQSDEKQVVVITLTGENKGASMLMSPEARKEAPIHIHRGYKTDLDESLESATDGEMGTNRKKSLDDKPAPAATACVNNNVQSVNNSIVVEASVSGRNPGVDMLLSRSTSEAIKAKGKSELIEARKAEFTSTSAERLTHEPTVRRRCLRGLFLESSDSEPENPNKPRRHGCRYSCGGKDKECM